MTRDNLLAWCLRQPGARPDDPWDGDLVVKVGGRIFVFLGAPDSGTVGIKCGRNRDDADEWLVRYPRDAAVMPYLGRFGWNSLRLGGAIGDGELLEAAQGSYDYVVSRLPRRDRPPPP